MKRLVAELSVEKQVLREVAQGNFCVTSGDVVRQSVPGSNMDFPNGMLVGSWGKREGHNDTFRFWGATKMR